MWIDRRWLIGLAVGSAFLNVFLVGLIVGGLHRHGHPDHAPPHVGGFVARERVASLPPEEKARFVAAMSTHRADVIAARQAQDAARRTVQDTLRAPVYDRAKVAAALDLLRKANLKVQEQSNAALVEALATLSDASRASVLTPEEPPHHF